ncbi:MAG: box helicase domain protein, partial [Firmicutes bacterium]|nr:box helicase domain protein [Bacillota bacterium]
MDEQSVAKYALSKEIAQALEELGYEILTKVQEKVIPLALA